MSASKHLVTDTLEVFGFVEVLVEELFEAVTGNLRAVVAKAVAKGIELLDEVGGGSDGKDLVSIVVHVFSCFLGSAISSWFFTSVF